VVNWIVHTGDSVSYSTRNGQSIGGLNNGQTYYIIAPEDNPLTAVNESHYIQLAATQADAFAGRAINLTPPLPGLAGDVSVNMPVFTGADVDPVANTITLNANEQPGVFFPIELGQAVIYREPGRTDADQVVTGPNGYSVWQSPNPAIDGTRYIPLIGGAEGLATGNYLQHGGIYYVMAARDQFNLIGDQLVESQTIQLGSLENETRGGVARIKFGEVDPSALGLSFSLGVDQILDSTLLVMGGISELVTSDVAVAAAGFTPQDTLQGMLGLQQAVLGNISSSVGSSAFDNLTALLISKYNVLQKLSPNTTQRFLQFGGAFTISFTDHKVETLITSTADLDSNDDMELTSNITEKLSLTAESETEPQPGEKDAKGNPETSTSAENSASVAMVFGNENNSARVIIEGDAQLDSMRAMRLISGVTYPFLVRPDQFIPLTAGALSDKIETQGFDAVNQYLDGLGGLTAMFNTWARSTADAEGVSVAGSINVVTYNNDAESIVQSGAQINQDPFYRPSPDYYTDPNYGNNLPSGPDNVTHSDNINNLDQHVVSIEATNYMQLMNLTGVFGFTSPEISLAIPSPAGIVDILNFANNIRNNNFSDITEAFGPPSAGAQAERGGVGGAVFLQFLNNTTHAIVEPNVHLYSGRQSGLNIKAEEAIADMAFSQAGADAGKLAAGGTFSLINQNSDTLADLAEGSVINGGRIDVFADSLETQVNWAGGVAKGKAVGAGIAVAVDNTNRNTRAIIGWDPTLSASPVGRLEIGTAVDPALADVVGVPGFDDSPPINGSVTARANVSGGVYTFAVAGAVVNTAPDDPDPTAGGKTSSETESSNTGIGIAGASAINIITDVTQASLSDADVHAAAVDVKANNQIQIVSATGGLAFANANSGNTSPIDSDTAAAVAGAFSDNEINSTTTAFILDSAITLTGVPLDDLVVENAARKLSVTADRTGDIWSLAAGIGGALAKGTVGGANAVALTGSVSINTVLGGGTLARIIDSQIRFEATQPTPPDAFAGSAFALNYLSTDTVPTIHTGDTVQIVDPGGADDGDVYEYIGTGSPTYDYTNGDHPTQVNNGQTVLRLAGTTDLPEGVFRYTGSAPLTNPDLGSQDYSDPTLWAPVNAQISAAAIKASPDWRLLKSDALVSATESADIFAIAGSLSLAVAKSGFFGSANALSVGLAIGTNVIAGDTVAQVENSTLTWDPHAHGSLSVIAETGGSVKALTAAGVLVGALAAKSAEDLAVAGSVSVDTITGNTTATVQGSTATLQKPATDPGSAMPGDSVTVTATNDAEIIAIGGALSFAGAASSVAGTAAAGSVGASFAVNVIAGDVVAEVDGSDVTAGGSLSVEATSAEDILALSMGLAAAAANSATDTALAVGVAGSVSVNTVRRGTQARIRDNSNVDADGNVTVSSTDRSVIKADAGGFALAVAGSEDSNAITVAVGASVAVNVISVDLLAVVDDSQVLDASALTVTTSSDASIDALTLVGSAAISVSVDGAEAYSGGAAFAVNVIADTAHAQVENSQVSLASGGVTVTASDTSSIVSDTGSAALAVAANPTESLAITLGVGVSVNTISDDVAAEIDGSTITSMAGVSVEATFAAEIFAFSYGLAGAIGGGIEDLGVGIAGAGSISVATIAGNATARIADSTVHAGGDVTVEATDSAKIDTFSGAAALAVGVSADVGVGVAVGVSVATNDIHGSTIASIDGGSTIDHAGSVTVKAISTETVHAVTLGGAAAAGIGLDAAGVAIAGSGALSINEVHKTVTASVEDSQVTATGLVDVEASDASKITADAGGFALAIAASSDAVAISVGVGASLAINDIGIGVSAAVDGTGLNAGDLTVAASSDASIDALGMVGTAAVAVGSFALGAAGAAAISVNTITDTVRAEIANNSRVNLSSGRVRVSARDSSHINADSGSAALAVAVSPGGFALAGGLAASLSVNKITNDISAVIDNSTVTSKAGVSVESTSAAGIHAYSFGLSGVVAAGAGPLSAALSGAGSGSGDTITNTITASIEDGSNVDAGGGELTVSATDSATIDTVAGAAALGVAAGLDIGVAVAVGIAVAVNDIHDNTIASIDGSTVDDAGSVSVTANSTAAISAITVAGSLAGAFGGNITGVGIAFAGAISINHIHNEIHALVTGNSTISDTGAVVISATDASAIIADGGGFAIAIAGAADGIAIGVGVGASVAINDIGNDVLAGVENSRLLGVRGLSVTASSQSSIDALSLMGAGALAISGVGAGALAGAAAMSVNTINNTIHARIEGSQVTLISGSVAVNASDTSRINADSGGAAIALAIVPSGLGIAVALGAGLSVNTIGDNVAAVIEGSTVTSTDGVSVEATSAASIRAYSFGIAGALAGGAVGGGSLAGAGSGSGADITNTTTAHITDSTVNAGGDLTVQATDSATINTVAGAIALSGAIGAVAVTVAVGLSLAINDIQDTTTAFIEHSRITDSGSVSIAADSTATINAITVAGAISAGGAALAGIAISGAGAISINNIDNDLEARAQYSEFDLRPGADFSVTAADSSHLKADAAAVSFALAVGITGAGIAAAVGASVAVSNIGNTTLALSRLPRPSDRRWASSRSRPTPTRALTPCQ
jgi:hypothetical protein